MNSRLSILLAEEEPEVAKVVCKYLPVEDFLVLYVHTLAQAKSALLDNPIDLILLSCTFQDNDALQALSHLRTQAPEIPVIVLMNQAEMPSAEKVIRCGAQDCLARTEIDEPSLVRSIRFAIERMRLASTLIVNEDRYRDLVEESRDLICTHDLDGNILSMNAWPARLLGYEPEVLKTMNIRHLLVPEFAHEFGQYLTTIKEFGMAQGFMAVRTSSGEKRIWEYFNTLRTEGVPFPIVRGMAHDVTDYRKNLRLIQEQKTIFENQARLLDLAYDAIYVRHIDGEIRYWNRGAEEMYGWMREEAVGRNCEELLKTRLPEDPIKILETMENNGQWLGELEQKRKDGTSIIVSSRWTKQKTLAHNPETILEINRDITEKKRSEQAVRLAEERLKLVSFATRDVIWDWNIVKNEVWWSSNLKDVFGYSTQDLDYDSWADKLHPEDRERILSRMRSDMENHIPFSATEYRFRHADGRYVDVLDRSCIEFGEGGNAIRMIGTTMDITEQKQAEQELENSLSLLEATLESTADGILVVSSEGKIVQFNRKFAELWRIPDDIIASRNDAQALAFVRDQLKDPDGFLRKVQELYAHPPAESFDLIEFRDGRVFERYSKPQFVGDRVIGRVWSFRDVTLRQLTERALQESEERYRTLFEESRDVVFISTPDGKIMDINAAGLDLFGYPKDEIPQLDIAKDLYWNPAKRKEYESLMTRMGFVKDFELTLKKKNGEKLIVQETSTVMKDSDGQIVAFLGIMRDVTELKQLQEHLGQLQKMETIGRLAGGVAHDFNNLMMAISGYSDLLLMQNPYDEILKENVVQIQKAVEQGASLTRQLLAFGRKQVLQPKNLDPNQVMQKLESMLRRLIGENIELITIFDEGANQIHADPIQIEQVIMNLAVNARDAMPGGGKLIMETANKDLDADFVRRHPEVLPGRYVMIAISDTGIGMDAETASRVFEPFFTTKQAGGGTGLGLATVYGIVKQSGGHVLLYTEPGTGSTFKIFLPAAKQVTMTPPKDNSAVSTYLCRPQTILLVDDNEEVRKSIEKFLLARGFTVLQANSGKEALEISSRHPHPVDLLLTDVVMPQMSGPQLAKILTTSRKEMKVLFLSGYAEEAAVLQDLIEPGSAFLAKPVSMETLFRKILDLLPSA